MGVRERQSAGEGKGRRQPFCEAGLGVEKECEPSATRRERKRECGTRKKVGRGGGNEATQVRVPDKRKKKVKGELPQALKLLSQGMGVWV